MLMMHRLCSINQGAEESVVHYHKRFLNLVKVLETQWGPLFPSKLGNPSFESNEQCCELFLTRLFLSGADKHWFGTLVEELRKQYLAKADNYPELLEATKNWLLNYQANRNSGGHSGDSTKRSFETSFHTRGGTSSWVKCYNCNEPGHVKKDCPCLKKPVAKAGSILAHVKQASRELDDKFAWDM